MNGSSNDSSVVVTRNMRYTAWLIVGLSLGAGCTRDVVMDELTVTRLGVAGGTAVSADGLVHLVLPAGALPKDTDISISTERGALARPSVASAVYTFGPEGTVFDAPVRLTMPARGVERPMIAQLTATDVIIAGDSTLDAATLELSASLAHFSSYAVVTTWDSCAGKVCGEQCKICDPDGNGCVEPAGTFACDPSAACVVASTVSCVAPADAGVPEPSVDAGEPSVDAGEPAVDAGEPEVPTDELEPNDTPSTAQPVTVTAGVPSELRGSLPVGDVDVYAIDVPVDGTTLRVLTFSTPGDFTSCAPGTDTVLTLLDAAGVARAQNDDDGRGMCSSVELVLDAGRYYAEVRPFDRVSGRVSSYYLGVVLSAFVTPVDAGVAPVDAAAPDATPTDAAAPDATALDAAFDAGVADAGSPYPMRLAEVEPNGTATTAQALALPLGASIYVDGVLTQPSDHELFRLTVPAGHVGHLRAESAMTAVTGGATSCTNALDTRLELRDAAYLVLMSHDDIALGNFCSRVEWDVVPGDYYLHLHHFIATQMVDHPYVLIIELE